MLPPTIFFLVVFFVVVLTRSLMGEGTAIPMNTYGAAALGALVVGKSILVADALPLLRRFEDHPRIVNVLWRTFLYLLVVLAFQLLEELFPLISKHGGLAAAIAALVGEVDWARFWATHLLFAVFMSLYCLGTALIDALGRERFVREFLGSSRFSETSASAMDP